MKALGLGLIALVGTAFALRAYAEGGCPQGMYPLHAPGVMGCAPIPQARQTGPRWAARWGALARDAAGTGVNGVSSGEKTEGRAIKVAMRACKKAGGTECKLSVSYSNACIFAAMPYSGDRPMPGDRELAWDSDADKARARALGGCQDANRMACKIEYSACSLPVLVN